MSNSTRTLRWLILVAVAGTVLLLRIFRGEIVHGLNPLLILLFLVACYVLWQFRGK